ncbi:MAG TPA: hypothetical protein DCE23_04360 [Firmicutes bacterium]|nr:hypothetical protein [Bacillota bacterium]
MDVFEKLKEKYDIEEDIAYSRMTIKEPINVNDFCLLKNIAKYLGYKEIKVERKASVYEKRVML